MSRQAIKQLSDQAHEAICANDFGTALARYQAILAIDPMDDSALHFIAMLLNLQGKYKSALEFVQRAIHRYKCSATYYTTLASIYRNLGEHPEAVKAIRTACGLRPRDPISLSNAAMILGDERRYDRAKEIFETALDIDPDNPFVHFNYSLLLLTLGDFENGWKEYEWRIPFHYNAPVPVYPKDPKDLKGKKIQVVAEQGYGDFIMFARYFRLLEEAGAQVFVNCPKALERLFNPRYCADPDFSIRVTSLASLFNKIPGEPYIKARGEKVLPAFDGIKVGIASRAVKPYNNEVRVFPSAEGVHVVPHPASVAYFSTFKRSLPHDFFDPISSLHGFKLYNLQIDTHHYGMENLNERIDDFSDLADFVDQMDLIITIDTALAHLAGAMGKPTWLLIPYDFDWRWQADREDSPWYPSMRIFRQPVRGDWYSAQDKLVTCVSDVDRFRC